MTVVNLVEQLAGRLVSTKVDQMVALWALRTAVLTVVKTVFQMVVTSVELSVEKLVETKVEMMVEMMVASSELRMVASLAETKAGHLVVTMVDNLAVERVD